MNNNSATMELTSLFDHVLEEHGFGWDHWHSMLWNLHNVRPEDWNRTPQGGGRTIREIVIHVGLGWLTYSNHAFGDATREWGDVIVDGIDPGTTLAEIEPWLRAAHRSLRDKIAALTDAQLGETRKSPWGDEYEIRRLIELQIQTSFYHTGEINHIRALLQENDDWDHQDMGREEPNK